MYYTIMLAIAVAFGFGTLLNASDTIQKHKENQIIQELKSS